MKQSGLIQDIALVLVLAATGVPSFAEQSAGGDSIWTRDEAHRRLGRAAV